MAKRNALNLFRNTLTGELDRKFLRVCSVYNLMKKGVIGKARALELLAQRHTPKEMQTLRGTVELWIAHPFKDLAIAA